MMILYMVRDRKTREYYKRGHGYEHTWVPQQKASVWTEIRGATSCIGVIKRRNKSSRQQREPEIVTLTTVEVLCD
jgi:hypothetical protein